jgi:hypothetical protein
LTVISLSMARFSGGTPGMVVCLELGLVSGG